MASIIIVVASAINFGARAAQTRGEGGVVPCMTEGARARKRHLGSIKRRMEKTRDVRKERGRWN